MATITLKEIAIALHVNRTTIDLALSRVPRVGQDAKTYLYERNKAREAVIRYFENLSEKYQRKLDHYAEVIAKARKL